MGSRKEREAKRDDLRDEREAKRESAEHLSAMAEKVVVVPPPK